MKYLLTTILILIMFSTVGMALQTGIIFNGDLQGENKSFLGFTARSVFGLGGLELAAMPKVGPDGFDGTSYRIIVSPSIGWGRPELRIYGALAPHLDIDSGELDFDPAKWSFGAGSSFAVAKNVIGFFEFFVEFDFAGNNDTAEEETGFADNTLLSVGITYNFDVGF